MCSPKLSLHDNPFEKYQKNTFDRVYCFVKLQLLWQTESFQRQNEVYVK